MRFRASVVFGAALGLATLLLVYQLISLPPDTSPSLPNQSYEALEARLKRLEKDISINHNTVDEIHGLLKKISLPGTGSNELPAPLPLHPRIKQPAEVTDVLLPKTSASPAVKFNTSVAQVHADDCIFSQSVSASTDIIMEEVYSELPFENPDGGAWKQGWELTYELTQWTPDNPLRVFVVPHSHNDPGWIKTFEVYYQDQTSHILDNMVHKLSEDAQRKFIWAEISFFAMWWDKQTPAVHDIVRKLVARGQLEIVTGGWVMPDEALSHYWALIDQLVTGHEWLRTHLNVRPNNGWAIDPFGMSPTMAYILKRSGLENMLIQRTHYAIKKYLAANKNLEFRWRQAWDPDGSTEILCHMMPFYSYDVPHTCGPDPKVCCQFDFRRLPGSRITCPWRVPPQPITPHNVQSRAKLILDQYHKKAQLYRTNVLLVPLGDDFRYDTAEEWDQQYQNYQALFDHMNAFADYHVQAQFGTLADYFHALREESRTLQQQGALGVGGAAAGIKGNDGAGQGEEEEAFFPSLSGDFFTYADRDDHYWSGYFTSRPYYKARSRMLAARIRAAEILFNLAVGSASGRPGWLPRSVTEQLLLKLDEAHRALGIFQHHDGIAGTSKDHVMLDYANKLLNGIHQSEHVIQFAAHALLVPEQDTLSPDTVYLDAGLQHDGASTVSVPRVLVLGAAGRGGLLVGNTHPHHYHGLASVRVDSPYIKVVNGSGSPVVCQVDPVLEGPGALEVYDVHFPVQLPPLSLARFVVTRLEQVDRRFVHYATVTVKNFAAPTLPSVFPVVSAPADKPLLMSCGGTVAAIGSGGLLETVVKDGVTWPLVLQFVGYRARQNRETSGGYLFLPEGPAVPVLVKDPNIVTVTGPLHCILLTRLPLLLHTMSLQYSPGVEGMGLSVRNLVNVRREKNFELAMRVISDVDSGETFYTDLNGFQLVRRVRADKLTLQGNYYPVASQLMVQDQDGGRRITVLTGQPQGGGSLGPGQLEVMQDRRLMQDDHRGLEQGITDNVVTPNVFVILMEKRVQTDGTPTPTRSVFPSLAVESRLSQLLFPPLLLLHSSQVESSNLRPDWSVGTEGVACDVQLVGMRSIRGSSSGPAGTGASAALTLRRAAVDCSFPPPPAHCSTNGGKVQLNDVLGAAFSEDVRQSTLTYMYAGVNITKSFILTLQPMELYTFLLHGSVGGR